MTTTVRAADFVGSLGVNTHIDFGAYGYENLSIVESAINYLGLKNIHDSAQTAADAQTWLQVSQATGAKFDDYIAETSPAAMTTDLGLVQQLASEGVLNFVEGGNEEDDAYPASLGNTLQIAAQFQQQVYATGHALGLPVINMGFGAGWTAANNWQGDYGTVGDLSAFTDFGNAHVYPNVAQGTDWAIQRMNGLAQLAAASRPVITTEIGWDLNAGFTPTAVAKNVLNAAMDGMKDGNPLTYFYGLFNDGAGAFGLMNQDGTPTVAGTALHNLTTLLADTGATASTFAVGTLGYALAGTTTNDNALLIEKSDGSYWLSMWDETDAAHTVTLTLAAPAEIRVFDPLTGTATLRDVLGATAAIAVTDHPVLVEVLGASSVPVTTPPPPAPAPSDLSIVAPATETVPAGSELAVTGVSISDAWAATAPGSMTLNVWDSGGGTIAMAGESATSAGWISVAGSLAQLNADLAGLTYTAGPSQGGDSITVDVWNQGGVEAQKLVGVTVSAPVQPPPPPTTVTIAATDANPVVNDSNVTITATSGNHMLFIGGTHDTAVLTGGTETVQAYQGYNMTTTGSGNDTLGFGGSGNRIDAGAGHNTLYESGSANTLVTPGAGQGLDDFYGYVLQNGDVLDFTAALKGTAWDRKVSDVGSYLHVGMSGNDAIISISNNAGGAASKAADLHGSGAVDLKTLLAHSTI